MDDARLFRVRIALVQAFLIEHGYDGILLSRADNFAMATGGKRNYVSIASDLGASSLFVTRDGASYFVGNNIERTRVVAEELADLGCGVRDFLWFEGSAAGCIHKEFSGALVSDDGSLGANVNGALAYVRSLLTDYELERYRRLGRLAAEAVTAVAEAVAPGQTEADIAAMLIAEGAKRRCYVPVALIAADERIAAHRHPLPTMASLLGGGLSEKAVRGYVMIVGGFLREGLVASITRFKRVGELPSGILDAHARVCGVDASMQEASEPGRTLGDVLAASRQAYPRLGFADDEWHRHHQGGTTGYAGRTCKPIPGESFPILDTRWQKRVSEPLGEEVAFGQAFAWNPSAPGVKSEDTFLMLPDGTKEIVTATPAFPQVDLAAVLGRETDAVKSAIL